MLSSAPLYRRTLHRLRIRTCLHYCLRLRLCRRLLRIRLRTRHLYRLRHRRAVVVYPKLRTRAMKGLVVVLVVASCVASARAQATDVLV
jgi:hypothetical protein